MKCVPFTDGYGLPLLLQFLLFIVNLEYIMLLYLENYAMPHDDVCDWIWENWRIVKCMYGAMLKNIEVQICHIHVKEPFY